MSTSVRFDKLSERFEVPRAIEVVERRPAVAAAVAGLNAYVDNRIAQAVETLDRSNLDDANVQVAMTAVLAFLPLLYKSVDGKHYNVDVLTWRVNIPVPWGSSGKTGLRVHSQQRVLRALLIGRQRNKRHSAMFLYGDSSRRWYIAKHYDTLDKAQAYWGSWPITRGEWRESTR